MDAQIAAGDPLYSPSLWAGAVLQGIGGGKAKTTNYRLHSSGNSEGPNLIHTFDLATGLLDKSINTWTTAPFRWCAMHTDFLQDKWYGLVCNPLGGTTGFSGKPDQMGQGPWETKSVNMLKSGSFVSDTSMTATSPADDCGTISNGIYHQANPVCVTVNMPPPHSTSPYQGGGHPYENEKFPCPSDSPFYPNDSCLQGIAVGDQVMVTTSGEMMVALSVGPDQGPPNHLRRVTFIRGVTTNIGGAQATSTGWNAYMMPTSAQCGYGVTMCTPGTGFWADITAPSISWALDPGAFGGHSDGPTPSPTPGNSSFCRGGECRYDMPFASQIGQPSNVTFGGTNFNGTGNVIQLQSYPSIHQVAAPASRKKWMLDYYHMNPSGGVGAEYVSTNAPFSYSLVTGTSSVYKVTSFTGNPADYKHSPPIGYSGYHLWKDMSGPSSAVSDATLWAYCWALLAGECRVGSSAGDYYFVAHDANTGSNCVTDSYATNYPCMYNFGQSDAMMTQRGIDTNDFTGVKQRWMGMGLMGPGRQYQFSTFVPDPTGTWGVFQGNHINGQGDHLMAYLLPPDTTPDGIGRSNFVNIPVTYGSGATGDTRRIRFGYAEFGRPDQLYGTPRGEPTATDGTGAAPFLYASEPQQWKACANGCTINVPLIPGKIAWIVEDKKAQDGTVTSAPLRAVAEPVIPSACADLAFQPSFAAIGVGSNSGVISVTVTDQTCAWTAASSAGWLAFTGGSGAGNGSIQWSVTANSGAQRSAGITAGNASFSVTQAGGCTTSISPASASFAASGGSSSVTVTASDPSCTWTATSPADWAAVNPASGAGNGTVSASVAANPGSGRGTSLSIAGQSFAVTQDGISAVVSGATIVGGVSSSGVAIQ
jgi:hypothetical protein